MTPRDDLVSRVLREAARRADLRRAFAERGVDLVQTYRLGPYGMKVLFASAHAVYWTLEAQADRGRVWTQETLDAWLVEELLKKLEDWRAEESRAP